MTEHMVNTCKFKQYVPLNTIIVVANTLCIYTCLAVMLVESKWSAMTSLLDSCSRSSTTTTYPSTSSSSVYIRSITYSMWGREGLLAHRSIV